jgi:uncharacterized protein YggU (UPF0235/DUF167 family)
VTEGRRSPGTREPRDTWLWVRVKARAAHDRFLGWNPQGFLEMQLKAVPERSQANRAAVRVIARSFGVAPEQVVLEKGHTSRLKRFRLRGISENDVRARFGEPLGKRPPGAG